MPRFHVDLPLASGLETALPEAVARHVQVLRLQPGAALTLFDGGGSEWDCELLAMQRGGAVQVRVGTGRTVDRELPLAVSLAVGMPANERMDWLVEKATELGVAAIQPLVCERSVLRLAGERADKRRRHWQSVASAAAEQCGRARLPSVEPVCAFADWLAGLRAADDRLQASFLLSLGPDVQPFAEGLRPALQAGRSLLFASGPEGGFSPAEDAAARAAGLQPLGLGPRVLRADTAPLLAIAALAALFA